MNRDEQKERLRLLKRGRSVSWFIRISMALLAVMVVWSWLAPSPYSSILTPERKSENLTRFMERIVPRPVRDSGEWSSVLPWLKDKLVDQRGLEAMVRTLALAVFSTLLAGAVACALIPLAARNLMNHRPLGIRSGMGRMGQNFLWVVSGVVRGGFVITRSVPEYLLGFLLISVLGPDPWTLVLALAIHNVGIMGRLGAEVVENNDVERGQTVLAHGGGRFVVYLFSILPETISRILVYLFYRWETCIREATVLGMLGIVSLGYLFVEAKAARRFDDLVLFVLLGASLVLLGDLMSALIRRRISGSRR